MEQQVQVVPLLVPPEILFQQLPQQRKQHQKQRSPGNHSTKQIGVDKGTSQLKVWVRVYQCPTFQKDTQYQQSNNNKTQPQPP